MVESVNLNVVEPALIPKTAPLFSIVATAIFVLTQVPPVVGLKVVYSPIQIEDDPVKTVDGLTFTVIGAEASEVQLDPERV